MSCCSLKKSEITDVQQKLFNDYKKLVPFHAHKIAKKIGYNNLDFEDLCSAGYECLWEAILKFKSERNATFKVYLNLRVRGGLLDYLRKNSPCCTAAYALYRKVKTLVSEEISQSSDTEQSESISAFLTEYLSDADIICRSFNLSPEEELFRREKYKEILKIISGLSTNQQLVIKEHYLHDKSFVQIMSENSGLSTSWITRLHKIALKKLKVVCQGHYSELFDSEQEQFDNSWFNKVG